MENQDSNHNKEKPSQHDSFFKTVFKRIENAINDTETIQFEKSIEKAFPQKRFINNTNIRIAALFIAIISISVLVYHYCTPDYKKLFSEYYAHFNIENASGLVRSDTEIKTQAFNYYIKNDFKSAIQPFLKILEVTPQNVEIQFLLAQCYIEIENYKKAELLLSNLLKKNVHFYTDDSKWYLALIKIRENDKKEALKLLAAINTDSPYFSDAINLIDKIKN